LLIAPTDTGVPARCGSRDSSTRDDKGDNTEALCDLGSGEGELVADRSRTMDDRSFSSLNVSVSSFAKFGAFSWLLELLREEEGVLKELLFKLCAWLSSSPIANFGGEASFAFAEPYVSTCLPFGLI
jgi:hypothetical protein